MARVEVKVPQLSESVTEATLLPWKKKAGDAVTADEILIELETDKMVLEVPAPASGVLKAIVKKEGDVVHADEVLAAIDTEAKASAAAGSGPGGYIAAIRAARQKGRLRRGMDQPHRQAEARWHVSERRLHSVEGAARFVRAIREGEAAFRRPRHHHGQPRRRCRQDGQAQGSHRGKNYRWRRVPVPQEQDHLAKGHGKLAGKDGDNYKIDVSGDGKTESHTAQYVIIATGSKVRHLPNVPVDNKIVSDNEGALAFDTAPKKLAVIGAGVIGLELGSVWRRLGAEVTILLEALPDFLGTTDTALQKEAAKLFKKQGLTIHLGVKIDGVKAADKSVSISYKDKDGNAQAGRGSPDRVHRPRAEHG